jgi:hypothetical protein
MAQKPRQDDDVHFRVSEPVKRATRRYLLTLPPMKNGRRQGERELFMVSAWEQHPEYKRLCEEELAKWNKENVGNA